MTSSALEKYGVFYPYRVKDHERPDTIAFDYYGDSKYAWLVLMANDILDPYNDWPMSDADFNSFIVSKYGSVEQAMEQVDHFVSKTSTVRVTPTTRRTMTSTQQQQFAYPVMAWDIELEKNEARKTIKLLSKKYAVRAYEELRGSFTNDRA
jgi:hypothetical protein